MCRTQVEGCESISLAGCNLGHQWEQEPFEIGRLAMGRGEVNKEEEAEETSRRK
jgi:hypothetical protein